MTRIPAGAWRFYTVAGDGEFGRELGGRFVENGVGLHLGLPAHTTGQQHDRLGGKSEPDWNGDVRRGRQPFRTPLSRSMPTLDCSVHFQFTPHGFTTIGTPHQVPVILDGMFRGTQRKMVTASRNSFYYVDTCKEQARTRSDRRRLEAWRLRRGPRILSPKVFPVRKCRHFQWPMPTRAPSWPICVL
jgi:hypothetical protein